MSEATHRCEIVMTRTQFTKSGKTEKHDITEKDISCREAGRHECNYNSESEDARCSICGLTSGEAVKHFESQPQRSEFWDHPQRTEQWTPDLFMGERLIPFEHRPFATEQIATDLGYKIIGRYIKIERANAALAAEREERKPLVDALRDIQAKLPYAPYAAAKVCRDALAKVGD